MMTDTIIANLPIDGLRTVLRSLLASHPEITPTMERETRKFAAQGAVTELKSTRSARDVNGLKETQKMVRCMLGSGLCYESLPLLGKLVIEATDAGVRANADELLNFLASVDGDIVQTMTAVQKTLFVDTGIRTLADSERGLLVRFSQILSEREFAAQNEDREYSFSRGLAATRSILGTPQPHILGITNGSSTKSLNSIASRKIPPPEAKETFLLGSRKIPRIFSGLWQMSSPAWGTAPTSKIVDQISKHVQGGFTAFDMADHYGDAEIIFGRFWSSYPYKDAIFTATKYCVFHPMTVSREAIRANVSERCSRLQQPRIDLLQFHWQFYENPQYIEALRYLAEDDRVAMIGLCNFDTEHLQVVIDNGINIHANQVQFSLIDSRPTVLMGEVCNKYKIKLLTYGTLCGGFLSDKWLGKPEPDLYDESITPSQRKYHGMIRSWGDWALFQDLLKVLKSIAVKHQVGISNVATRWVLDVPYVGAVIVGARMGISEHTDSNLASFGWTLDSEDQQAIEQILLKSKRMEIFETMGDCGGEYRM
ncbi:hypothetical protein G7046_g5726 [Stylonectria norvegica]|nr:hypothetical protein G7046_g5726 [Stylonectria norvegica]